MQGRFSVYSSVVVCILIFATASPTQGQVPIVSLKERLENDLRARLPRDFAVIDLVVGMVNAKTLPKTLVDKAYYWTKANVPASKNRVIHFEQALRSLAGQRRIVIPAIPANLSPASQTRMTPVSAQPGFVATFFQSLQRTLRGLVRVRF